MITPVPPILEIIEKATSSLGFSMGSDRKCGSFLRTMAASKPGGLFLELGTGTGLSTAWLLDGMDKKARLISVDNDPEASAIALKYLGEDERLRLHVRDAGELIGSLEGRKFDLIFADTWAGKYTHLEETLALLKTGGIYILDDMLPQSNWPEGHEDKVRALLKRLGNKKEFVLTWLTWSTGIIVGVKN